MSHPKPPYELNEMQQYLAEGSRKVGIGIVVVAVVGCKACWFACWPRDDKVVSNIARAFISILALTELDMMPAEVLPDLWPPGQTQNRVDYFWFMERFYCDDGTPELVDLTPGDARYFGLPSCPVPFVATGMILAAIDSVGTVITVGRADAPTVFELCFQVVGWGVCGVLPRLRRALKAGLLRAILLCRAASVDVQEVRRLLTRELPCCSIHYHVLHQMLISLREVDDLATPPAFTSSPVFEEWTNLVDLASSGELSWIMLIPKIIHCIGHATMWR
ncbi:hypothetical protein B0H13DRAFT_2338348 [Mycena leptocephala]|nr:hypothetical protein B0H13DRAFT_2338348 [Mycena leptocephala]